VNTPAVEWSEARIEARYCSSTRSSKRLPAPSQANARPQRRRILEREMALMTDGETRLASLPDTAGPHLLEVVHALCVRMGETKGSELT
jgi:hypothetical protein